MVFNCPHLKEVSLDFSRQENDRIDLTTIVNGLGISCPKLQNIHIASVRLSHAAVLALTASNFRGLRMLSLVLGSEITDASVAAIASSYSNLELLDLSGSSISDSGFGMICNVFPETLLKLLLALSPNITSSGIQFAAAQLPRLELMDCGMTICDPNLEISKKRAMVVTCRELPTAKRLLLQCPNLESVHASGCQDIMVKTIQNQVYYDFSDVENHFPYKRLPVGSKRVRVPYLFSPQP
ncbi:F-box/LRR-repeat protein 17 [Forsythia ovata]|uniref:F-box/LRR-repeat protein 17 n=1 Tax=Forsythia ovata TaxID=205694 RepID=A0ABD1TNV0_9LAMI